MTEMEPEHRFPTSQEGARQRKEKEENEMPDLQLRPRDEGIETSRD